MTISVFLNARLLIRGPSAAAAQAVRALAPQARASDVLAFDDDSGRQVDLDVREPAPAAPRPRGRPALGVEAREVTLMPRHWQWLARQPGGASAALRRLVEQAAKAGRSRRERCDAAYQFLTVMAGDLPGYEEAMRALYADDAVRFDAESAAWPVDVRAHGRALAWGEDQGAAA